MPVLIGLMFSEVGPNNRPHRWCEIAPHCTWKTMMSAVAAIPVNPTLSQRLAGLDQGQRLRLGLGIVLFVAIGIVGW